MNKTQKKIAVLCSLALLLQCAVVASAATIHVTPAGDDAADGATWATSKLTVNAALDISTNGDQVWVAAGTYEETINLKDGVALYGGFNGSELQLTDRDWELNETILQTGEDVSVVTAASGVSDTARIDGFTIRHLDNASGSAISCVFSSPTIANNMLTHNMAPQGAGIYCEFATALIKNNTIVGNTSTEYGGGLCGVIDASTILGNTFRDNQASAGGGIYLLPSADQPCKVTGNTFAGNRAATGAAMECNQGIVDIEGNRFSRNEATGSGGALRCGFVSGRIVGNDFRGNEAARSGGALLLENSDMLVANNNIVANIAELYGSGVYITQSGAQLINNTIVGNKGWGGGILAASMTPVTFHNNIVAFNVIGVNFVGAEPVLQGNCVYGNHATDYQNIPDPTGTDGNISEDPLFVDLQFGNVHLTPESPCRDAGDDSVVLANWLDIDDQNRIGGQHVDIGADESYGETGQPGPYVAVRVAPDGDDFSDGASWFTAKRTVQKAIDAACASGGEVWVQAGVYDENINLLPFVRLYGGFDGTETSRSQRNWSKNKSILDGGRRGSVVRYDDWRLLASSVDGFVIRNGGGFGDDVEDGAGIHCRSSTLTVADNTIIDNRALSPNVQADGGGIYCHLCAGVMANNVIVGNSAWRGGGVCCEGQSPVVIANNTIANNHANREENAGAGGIYAHSSVRIANNIVVFNSSGVFASSGSSAPSNNCLFGNDQYDAYAWPPLPDDRGNISANPLFRDANPGPDNEWGTEDDILNDLRLSAGSPCIDAGTNGLVPADIADLDDDGDMTEPIPFDLDGAARFVDTTAAPDAGTSPIVDIGAYEFPRRNATIHVTTNSDDTADGATWATARQTVNAALDISSNGDQVWVAAGTYEETFILTKDVAFYGGFAGSETRLTDRDWEVNETILQTAEDANVVEVSFGVIDTARIDGFTIRHINGAEGSGIVCRHAAPVIANNLFVNNTAENGAGVDCEGDSPARIVNNRFLDNTATGDGGGVKSFSSTIISGNTFARNVAASGGAVYVYDINPLLTLEVYNNTFTDNRALQEHGGALRCFVPDLAVEGNVFLRNEAARNGAAVFCYATPGVLAGNTFRANHAGLNGGALALDHCPLRVADNIIIANAAELSGGGVYYTSIPWGDEDTPLVNNTIVGNSAVRGGGVHLSSYRNVFTNNIIAYNSSGIERSGGDSPQMYNNCVYGNAKGNFNSVGDPTGQNGNISVNPLLVDLTFGNIHLQPNSPCRNVGDDSVVQAGSKDIDEQGRIEGAHVDIGADESYGEPGSPGPQVIVRVAPDGADLADGASWSTAMRTVQAAVDTAASFGGEVWVKAGVYDENIEVPPGVHLYGGFAGTERQRVQRDWIANESVLDGGRRGSVVTVRGPRGMSRRIDGFVIRNGGRSDAEATNGGGINCDNATLTIANNVIKNNWALAPSSILTGGGVCCYESDAIIVNNLFAGNRAGAGGGIALDSELFESPSAIVNNTIVGNLAARDLTYRGGGGISARSPVNIVNNVIVFNSSGIDGWGYYRINLDRNCVFGSTAYDIFGWTELPDNRGNISVDPLFRDANAGADGVWTTEDDVLINLRLSGGSPCIDAGRNVSVPSDTADIDDDGDTTEPIPFDLDGAARLVDTPAAPDTGAGTPPIVDIGAYEFAPGDGDFDYDGDLDLSDYGFFTDCLTGPGAGLIGPECRIADFDGDGDVDLKDAAAFTAAFTQTADPN